MAVYKKGDRNWRRSGSNQWRHRTTGNTIFLEFVPERKEWDAVNLGTGEFYRFNKRSQALKKAQSIMKKSMFT